MQDDTEQEAVDVLKQHHYCGRQPEGSQPQALLQLGEHQGGLVFSSLRALVSSLYDEYGSIDVSMMGKFHVLTPFLEGGLFRGYVVTTSTGLSHTVAICLAVGQRLRSI